MADSSSDNLLTCPGNSVWCWSGVRWGERPAVSSLLAPQATDEIPIAEEFSKLSAHLEPKPSEIVETYKILKRDQSIQHTLLSKDPLSFKEAVDIAMAIEATGKNILDLRGKGDEISPMRVDEHPVHAVAGRSHTGRRPDGIQANMHKGIRKQMMGPQENKWKQQCWDKVGDTIDKLVMRKAYEAVPYSSWATPVVPIMKSDGSIRICADYKGTINPACKPECYPLPTINEALASLAGEKYFT
ncbi:uncharacterized protein LOC134542891 [Bacillus rossius redtenbacheri]|uniref:uncharacterized protein LOC134542891 n=1 Tax=Bacillus rossius redtenbacheri TaxID=93214 RepID=UPI002FDE81CA